MKDNLLTVVESSKTGRYVVIDGNHRLALFQEHGIDSWNCKVIPKDMNLSKDEVAAVAYYMNELHDSGAVHATYWECVEHIANLMPHYRTPRGYDWNSMASLFKGKWFTIANLTRAGTLINNFIQRTQVFFKFF